MEFNLRNAPVPALLNSLALLHNTALLRGASQWLTRTAAALSAGVLQRNELVARALLPALVPDEDYADFPAYLAELAASDPGAWRDQLLRRLIAAAGSQRAGGSARAPLPGDLSAAALLADRRLYLEVSQRSRPDQPLGLDLQTELHALFNDPPALHALVVEHLTAMWERWLQPEWRRALPALESALDRLRRLYGDDRAVAEATRAAVSRTEGQEWDRLAAGARRTVVLPSPHNGAMTTFLRGETTLWVCAGLGGFNADLAVRSTPVGRSELLFRLQALADDARLRIIELLHQHEELSAQEIILRAGISQSSASRHLNHLRNAGYLRERRRDGANKYYRLMPAHIADTFAALESLLAPADVRASAPPSADVSQRDLRGPAETPAPASGSLAVPESIRRYINDEGRMVVWPSKQKDRLVVAAYLAEQFAAGRSYSEREVNAILKPHTGSDAANLRRFMFDSGLLNREADGSRYWRDGD